MTKDMLWEGLREGCGTCEFGIQTSPHNAEFITCRRFPPTVDPNSTGWRTTNRRPVLEVSDWCGEYKRKIE